MLIVTEGVKTEIQYLEGMVQFLRSSGASVRGVRSKGIGRDPGRVVKAALEINAADVDGYDEIWVLVDVDEHATLEAAISEAMASAIPMVISNPCFEIWLLWHYEDCAAHKTAQQLERQLAKRGHADKKVPTSFPYGNHPDATKRASVGLVEHSVRGPNPSTAMPVLIAALQRGA